MIHEEALALARSGRLRAARQASSRAVDLALQTGQRETAASYQAARAVYAGADLRAALGALKVAIHRLRKRYRDLFRQEIAETVADATEVESELRYLAAALTRRK